MLFTFLSMACVTEILFSEPDGESEPGYVEATDTAPDAEPETETGDTGEGADSGSDSDGEEIEHTGVEDVVGVGADTLIYDPAVVHQVAFTISDASWQSLLRNGSEYAEVEMTFDGEPVGAVGIRIKGSSTYQSITGKPSLKVKVNYVDEEKKLHNTRRLTLNNLIYDRSMMAEQLSYMVYREAGVAAPRTSYTWITLNDQPYGLYSIVETMDELLIDQWWDDDDGWMYESQGCDFSNCGCYSVDEPGDGYDGTAELQEICGVANLQGESFYEGIQEPLDWDNFMMFQGVEAVLAHWDGYAYNVNNYHLYHEPTLDKWYFLPWSTDLAWGWNPWSSGNCGNYATDPMSYDNGRLVSRCGQVEECRQQMYDGMLAAAELLESLPMQEEIDRIQEMIWPYVEEDPKMNYSVLSAEQQVDCLRSWISSRPDFVRDRLSGPENP